MQIMDFSSANCKNCYKCIQNCHVKAIKLIDNQATIMKERCIACGQCFVVCPQNARNVVSDLDVIKTMRKDKKLIASIAPSYLAIYDNPQTLISSLKALGFSHIEETAIGAENVSQQYAAYMKEHQLDNYITSCCPAITTMIEVYYPELLQYLLPIESPMAVHSKILREKYGEDAFITFIGPCIAKKKEAFYYKQMGTLDAVLTFEEVENWIQQENVVVSEESNEAANNHLSVGQSYPIEEGIIVGLQDCINSLGYETLSVSGLEGCKSVFSSLCKGEINGTFIEANACIGSCIGGPALPKSTKGSSIFVRQLNLTRQKRRDSLSISDNSQSYERPFSSKPIAKTEISENEIQRVLHSMGKYSKADELNCGACGYNTCIEKARAVFEGMSHPEMCIHFMREKAESLTNTIFEHSPNIIFLLDKDLNIIHLNPAAKKIFMTTSTIQGEPIGKLLNEEDFKLVKSTKENIIGKKVSYLKYGLVCIENIIYLEEQNSYLVILHNLTEQVKRDDELAKLKQNTLSAAQNVIDKQMRVAQEIAGLLGETTAETKITLMKLQQIVIGEEGEMK